MLTAAAVATSDHYVCTAINRLSLLRNKKRSQVDILRRQIKELLEAGKVEQAQIKAEQVIREGDVADA